LADDGKPAIHLYDATSMHGERLPSIQPHLPVIEWPWVVWPDVAADAHTPAVARWNIVTQALAAPPKALVSATAFGMQDLAGAPGLLAWTGSDSRSVYVWRETWPAAKRVYVAESGAYAEYETLGQRFLAFTGLKAEYVTDLQTFTTAALTPSFGSAGSNGRGLFASYGTSAQKGAPSDVHPSAAFFLDTQNLSGIQC
jgi:hypothetical protein